MNPISFNTTSDKFVISIDKNAIDKNALFVWLELLRIEQLAQEVNFDDTIIEFGEELKENWWAENKKRFITEE